MTEEKISKENNDLILSKINDLQSKINSIDKNRKTTSYLSLAGFIIVIIILVIFFHNIVSFVKHYDTESLVKDLGSNAVLLLSSEEGKQLANTIRDDLLPKYQKALITKTKESAPMFVQDIDQMQRNLYTYGEDKIKPKILNNLTENLYNSEAANLAEYFNSDKFKDKLATVLEISHKKFSEDLPDAINKSIDPTLIQMNTLNASFNNVYEDMMKSGEFKGVSADMTGEIENRLVENILELIIYQLNPEKGKQQAN